MNGCFCTWIIFALVVSVVYHLRERSIANCGGSWVEVVGVGKSGG